MAGIVTMKKNAEKSNKTSSTNNFNSGSSSSKSSSSWHSGWDSLINAGNNSSSKKNTSSSKNSYSSSGNRDISMEIANETNEKRRQELLSERQQYIDANGLNGLVPSNALVSTWRGSYTPGSWNSPEQRYDTVGGEGYGNGGFVIGNSKQNTYSPSALYSEMESVQNEALQNAKNANNLRLQNELASAQAEFDNAARNAQVNSRLTALGNEEKLAALGLSGGAYNAPSSGYGESSRVALDNALREDLRSVENNRTSTINSLKSTAAEIDNAISQDAANNLAKIALEEATAMYNFYKEENAYKLDSAKLLGVLDGYNTLDKVEYYNELNTQNSLTEYENAMERWRIFGTVLASDAEILGVPVGSKTADKAYDDRKLWLEQQRLYK